MRNQAFPLNINVPLSEVMGERHFLMLCCLSVEQIGYGEIGCMHFYPLRLNRNSWHAVIDLVLKFLRPAKDHEGILGAFLQVLPIAVINTNNVEHPNDSFPVLP